ncbi:MAG: hypothetical protein Q8L34_03105 [Candidatus Woesearchaeota archaeon]|nr:hypothetical protein [Candidatus Woesearchaeota archaeon]
MLDTLSLEYRACKDPVMVDGQPLSLDQLNTLSVADLVDKEVCVLGYFLKISSQADCVRVVVIEDSPAVKEAMFYYWGDNIYDRQTRAYDLLDGFLYELTEGSDFEECEGEFYEPKPIIIVGHLLGEYQRGRNPVILNNQVTGLEELMRLSANDLCGKEILIRKSSGDHFVTVDSLHNGTLEVRLLSTFETVPVLWNEAYPSAYELLDYLASLPYQSEDFVCLI